MSSPYFVMKIAIARLGGISSAAKLLKVDKYRVAAWVAPTRRSRPSDHMLERVAEAADVPLEVLQNYYEEVERYKQRENFSRSG